MGVVISICRGLSKASEASDDTVRLMNDEAFSGHSRLESGHYNFEKQEHVFDVSYFGYNDWRSWIAEMVGYRKSVNRVFDWHVNLDRAKPFSLLFDFSDCEGNWDYQTCKLLAEDFRSFLGKSNSIEFEYEPFNRRYVAMLEALDSVGENDCIFFH